MGKTTMHQPHIEYSLHDQNIERMGHGNCSLNFGARGNLKTIHARWRDTSLTTPGLINPT